MDAQEIRRARLKELLDSLGRGGKARLAEMAGTSPAYISQITSERTKANVGSDLARRIEKAFGKPHGWMDRLEPETAAQAPTGDYSYADVVSGTVVDPEIDAFDATEHKLRKGRKIPVVGQAQGGPDGYISIHDYPAGHSDGWLVLATNDPYAYGLRVRGDSMRPRIKSGEYIMVEPSFEAQPGDDVVVKFQDGSAVAKELLWVRDDEVCLGSINNGVPPMTRPISAVQTIHRIAAIIPRGSPLYQAAS
ncbi:hypothetical protein BKK79_19890 [Cupriavidus sp. USMAA2-4]|nr:hypothetical protein BKK79_19890 [Cupriavidus sp. USMAA2-4]